MSNDRISACDAVYAFAAWLSCRPGTLTIGASHLATPMADLAKVWTEANGVPEVSPTYPDNITQPPHTEVTLDVSRVVERPTIPIHPRHSRLRPQHRGVYDDVVLASDYDALRDAFTNFVQAVTDPENQPSQYGTTLAVVPPVVSLQGGTPRTDELACAIYREHGLAQHDGDPYGEAIKLARQLEREAAMSQACFAEARYRPMGDNHHNALACPYCNPKGLKFADDAPKRERPACRECGQTLIFTGIGEHNNRLYRHPPPCRIDSGTYSFPATDTEPKEQMP